MKIKNILNEGYTSQNIFDKAKGQFLFQKNKKFIDLSFGAGTLILGHQSKVFKDSIKEISNKNMSLIATPNIEALKYSYVLKKLYPNYDKFIFCNTGSEAILKSIRIANAISSKELIISVT